MPLRLTVVSRHSRAQGRRVDRLGKPRTLNISQPTNIGSKHQIRWAVASFAFEALKQPLLGKHRVNLNPGLLGKSLK